MAEFRRHYGAGGAEHRVVGDYESAPEIFDCHRSDASGESSSRIIVNSMMKTPLVRRLICRNFDHATTGVAARSQIRHVRLRYRPCALPYTAFALAPVAELVDAQG